MIGVPYSRRGFSALSVAILLGSGCSSAASRLDRPFSDLSEKLVTARMEGRNSRPEWLNQGKISRDGSRWVVLGLVISAESQGISRGIQAAEKKAQQELAATIQGRLEDVLELDGGAGLDAPRRQIEANQFRAALLESIESVARRSREYWELIPGKYRAFVQVALSDQQLRTAVQKTGQKLKEAGKLNPIVVRALETHLSELVALDSDIVSPLSQMAPGGSN